MRLCYTLCLLTLICIESEERSSMQHKGQENSSFTNFVVYVGFHLQLLRALWYICLRAIKCFSLQTKGCWFSWPSPTLLVWTQQCCYISFSAWFVTFFSLWLTWLAELQWMQPRCTYSIPILYLLFYAIANTNNPCLTSDCKHEVGNPYVFNYKHLKDI